MKIIYLFGGKETLVDDEDYEFYNQWKWQLSPTGYVARSAHIQNIRRRVYLHRLVTRCPSDKVVDHINKNRLDNRKSNLRICSQKENTVANNGWKTAEIKYKGVSYMSSGGKKITTKYRARIGNKHLGCFDSPEEAARAYDAEAKKIYGRFAYLNFQH